MKHKNKKTSAEEGQAQAGAAEQAHAAASPNAASAGPTPAPAAAEVVPVETAEQAAKRAEQERFLRLQADFDNFRKRTARERSEIAVRATEDLVREVLPVLDHLELALEAAKAHKCDTGVLDGFRHVADQMVSVMRKVGIAEVEAAGQKFDPQRHEAVSHVSSNEVPEGGVIVQTRKGYMFGGRLLRPAQVVVSSGMRAAPSASDEPVMPEENGQASASACDDE